MVYVHLAWVKISRSGGEVAVDSCTMTPAGSVVTCEVVGLWTVTTVTDLVPVYVMIVGQEYSATTEVRQLPVARSLLCSFMHSEGYSSLAYVSFRTHQAEEGM